MGHRARGAGGERSSRSPLPASASPAATSGRDRFPGVTTTKKMIPLNESGNYPGCAVKGEGGVSFLLHFRCFANPLRFGLHLERRRFGPEAGGGSPCHGNWGSRGHQGSGMGWQRWEGGFPPPPQNQIKAPSLETSSRNGRAGCSAPGLPPCLRAESRSEGNHCSSPLPGSSRGWGRAPQAAPPSRASFPLSACLCPSGCIFWGGIFLPTPAWIPTRGRRVLPAEAGDKERNEYTE